MSLSRRPLYLSALALSLALAVPAFLLTDAAAQQADPISALEARVATLEQAVKTMSQGAEREKKAEQAAMEISQLVNAGRTTEAKAKLDAFYKQYDGTRVAGQLKSLRDELDVVGLPAPTDLGIEKWFVGGPQVPAGKATLYVFFEEWCPHCKREVPKLTALQDSLKDKGLVVLGLTKLTRGVTEEKLNAFINDNKVTYPIAKENGKASGYFKVSGIPAAAIVKDGKVVWRGNPGALNEAKVQTYL